MIVPMIKYAFLIYHKEYDEFLNRRKPLQSESQPVDGMELFKQVHTVIEELETNKQKLQVLKKDIIMLEPWGNFNAGSIERLREADMTLRFFTCPVRKFDESWKSHYAIDIISENA